jgi:hypothetical protein
MREQRWEREGKSGVKIIDPPASQSTSIAPQKEIESSLTFDLSQWRIAKVDLSTSASET